MNNLDKANEELIHEMQELQHKYNSLQALYEKDVTEHKLANEALRESEDRYRCLVETTDTGYVIIDITGCVIDANQEYVRLSGHKELNEILGRNVQEWTADEEKEINTQAVATCLKNGFIRNFEISYIDKSGKRTPIEINATVIEVDGKQKILTLCRDISERKRVEEIQKQTSSLLRATLESTADGILVVDLSGKITSFNKKFGELWQIPWQTLNTGNDNELISFILNQLKDPNQFLSKVKELYSQPNQESSDTIEFKDGRVFERYSQPQRIDNEIVGRVWSFRDITRHKQAELLLKEKTDELEAQNNEYSQLIEELYQKNDELLKAKLIAEVSEEKFNAITNQATEGIALADMNGNYVFVNPAFCRMTGYTEEELLEMTVYDVRAKSQSIVFFGDKDKMNAIPMPVVLQRKNGETFFTEIIGSIVKINNQEFILGTVRDITERKKAEELLHESENRFRKVVELAPIAMAIVSMDGIIEFINHKAVEVFGYTPADIPTMDSWWSQAYQDVDYRTEVVADWMGRVQKAITEGREIIGNEYQLTCKDGCQKTVFISGVPVANKIFVLFEDITERKQAEDALRESEERFSKAYKTSPISFMIASLEDGQIIEINEAFTTISGFTREEALASTTLKLKFWVHEEDRLHMIDTLRSGRSVLRQETMLRAKNGNILTVLLSAQAIQLGRKYCIISSIEDITERKKAEVELVKAKEIAESNANLIRNITDNIPAFIAVVDANTLKYKFVNLKFTIGFKKKREDILGAHISEVIGEANTKFAMKYIDEVKQGKTSSYINTFEIAEGKRYINVNYVPGFNDKGDVTEIIVLSFDVTSIKESEKELLKAKEKAEESDRLKTAFLQNMSHEIRTPMNTIMGFSSLLVENYNNKPKLEQFSDIINHRCNDLLEIINGILDIAKIESGQLPINIEECNLYELFTDLKTFFTEHQKRIGKPQINFNLRILSDPTESIIITDKVKLRQIFINLIGNAFKFTDKGKIEAGCKLDTNRDLIFYVSDTGAGIPPDKYDTIFERFAQLEHNKNLVYSGTGLGLPIVKGLVGLLGGKIWLESELEKGTTFYFSIPIKITQTKHEPPVLIDENQAYDFTGKTILLVEDDRFNAKYFKEILSGTGLKIIHAEYGKEAVQMAITHLPDLVLMDIRLPDIDGYEATRQIKQHNPNLKVIAQTAYAAHEDKQKAYDAGCIDYISKPLKRDLLLFMLNKHFSQPLSQNGRRI